MADSMKCVGRCRKDGGTVPLRDGVPRDVCDATIRATVLDHVREQRWCPALGHRQQAYCSCLESGSGRLPFFFVEVDVARSRACATMRRWRVSRMNQSMYDGASVAAGEVDATGMSRPRLHAAGGNTLQKRGDAGREGGRERRRGRRAGCRKGCGGMRLQKRVPTRCSPVCSRLTYRGTSLIRKRPPHLGPP